jgi:sulfite exporter TauE/SafE
VTWQFIISGLALGAISSFHCIGMCGAIAFSIPTHHLSSFKKAIAILLYNFGRVTTYSIIGLLFGLLGRQISMAGFQQWFSIVAGIVILMIVIQAYLKKPVFHLPGYNKALSVITKIISKFINKPSLKSIYLLGMANGLLPCGLVYLAVTGALAAGTIEGATIFMVAFGLGTLPAMFLLSYFKFIISLSVRNLIKRSVPYVVAGMAVLLILRGMGLGINFVSPILPTANANGVPCH